MAQWLRTGSASTAAGAGREETQSLIWTEAFPLFVNDPRDGGEAGKAAFAVEPADAG